MQAFIYGNSKGKTHIVVLFSMENVKIYSFQIFATSQIVEKTYFYI